MFLDEIRTKSSANDEFTEKKERIKKQNEKKKRQNASARSLIDL